MTFLDMLRSASTQNNSMLCVGLDPEPNRLPAGMRGDPRKIYDFCAAIVDSTADVACAFKPQIAYFAAHGAEDQLEGALRFFLSPKSAYVSAQVLRLTPANEQVKDWTRPLAGKKALVTGASRGLGAALAENLAARGWHVIAVGRTTGALEELDDRIRKAYLGEH